MTYTKRDFHIGQQVIVVNLDKLKQRQPEWVKYTAEVVKIGRTFVYAQLPGLWELQFDMETGLDAKNMRYKMFATLNDYIDYHNTYMLRPVVRRTFEKQFQTLSVDKLVAIAKILEIETGGLVEPITHD